MDRQSLANIATDEREKLIGFRVLLIFPFYLKYITLKTHIKLCKVKDQIAKFSKEDPKASDFYNSELQEKIQPLIIDYVRTALINSRMFGWFYAPFLNLKLNRCGHYHILNLYLKILKLDEPAFFLSYWTHLVKVDNTILKVEKQY